MLKILTQLRIKAQDRSKNVPEYIRRLIKARWVELKTRTANSHSDEEEIVVNRRNDINQWTEAEIRIHEALIEVEAWGAHPWLTDAVVLLGQAQDKVADFIDLKAGEQR